MNSFYVTLAANVSIDIYHDNKKSNFTTRFKTPLVLVGNNEEALANITCTPHIKYNYGSIILKK